MRRGNGRETGSVPQRMVAMRRPGGRGLTDLATVLLALIPLLSMAMGSALVAATEATPIEMSLTAKWTQLAPGQTMDVTVKAAVSGDPLGGADVALWATSGLTLAATSGTTGADGIFTTTVRAGSTIGPETITATVTKDPFAPGTASLNVNVACLSLLGMSLVSDTFEMMSFETATVRIRLVDPCTGAELTGANITTTSPAGGNFSAVTELGGGDYRFRWDAPRVTAQTFLSILVTAKVGGYADVRGRVVILVDPNKTNPQDPTQLFLIVEAEKLFLGSGETTNMTIFVFTVEGFAVRGATVTIRMLVPVGTFGPVVDRLNGIYTTTYTALTTITCGSIAARFDVSKYGYATGFTRTGLTICP